MIISGFSKGNQMQYLKGITISKVALRDESLSKSINDPPSEKDSYTKEDALLNEYMKQYRLDLKIQDGAVINNSDSPVRLILRDQVTDDDLKAYAQTLAEGEKSNEIDWIGLTDDLRNMETNLYNADKLNTKVDYLTSRYAYLKDYIQNTFTGTEEEENLTHLEDIYQNSKETLANSYSEAVGGFYETFGSAGTKDKMYQSLLSGIESRAAEYEDILKGAGDYSEISNQDEDWLRKDDSYMAARLRDYAAAKSSTLINSDSPVTTDNPDSSDSGYSLHDLAVAGIFAAESSQQYNSINMDQQPDDEQHIGLDLALQTMKTDTLIKESGIGSDMASLIKNTSQTYMEKYLNRLDENLVSYADRVKMPGTKRELDKEAVNRIYRYTLNQYQDGNDIKTAFQKGAERARSDYYSEYSSKGGYYYQKVDWDQFYNVPQYATNVKELSDYEKYSVTIDRFTESLKSGNPKNIELLFAPGGKTSADRFFYTAVDLYA